MALLLLVHYVPVDNDGTKTCQNKRKNNGKIVADWYSRGGGHAATADVFY